MFERLRDECKGARDRYVIFVTGDLGAGKTYWADVLNYYLGKSGIKTSVVRIDSFLLDRYVRHSDPSRIYDQPLLDQLSRIHELDSLRYPIYDFRDGKRLAVQESALEKAVIVEGCLLSDTPFSPDKVVYIDAPSPVRFARIALRDRREKRYSLAAIVEKYMSRRGHFERFVRPYFLRADLVVNSLFPRYPKLVEGAHLDKIEQAKDKVSEVEQLKVYKTLRVLFNRLPKEERKALSGSTLIARGTLAKNELREHSDWDLTYILKADVRGARDAAMSFLRQVQSVKPNSRNTGGMLVLDQLDDPGWDSANIVIAGMFTHDYIFGSKRLYERFQSKLKRRISRKTLSSDLIRQFEIRNRTFHLGDTKNSYGGIRDIHHLCWIAQSSFGRLNLSTYQVLDNLCEQGVLSSAEKHYLQWAYQAFRQDRWQPRSVASRLLTHVICARAVRSIESRLEALPRRAYFGFFEVG